MNKALFILGFVTVILIIPALATEYFSANIQDANAYAAFHFDTNTGVLAKDYSPNEFNLTFKAVGGSYVALGKTGMGYNFSKSRTCANASSSHVFNFSSSQSFSYSLWVKPKMNAASTIVLLNKIGTPATNYYRLFQSSFSTVVWRLYDSASKNMALQKTSVFVANKWVHLSFVYDSTKIRGTGYVNGINSSSATVVGIGSIQGTGKFRLGAGSNCGSGNFNGTMDEVLVYNFALTNSQIKEIYSCQTPQNGWATSYGDWRIIGNCTVISLADSTDAKLNIESGKYYLESGSLTIGELKKGAAGKLKIQSGAHFRIT
jgi:hypothetical protein